MKDRYIQVFTTISNKRGAEKIAKVVIKKRLGACIQIGGPIKSIYRWKGRVETAKEWVCIIKTRKSLYKKLEGLIKENHTYEIPEIVATPIIEADKDYLKWVSKETTKNY